MADLIDDAYFVAALPHLADLAEEDRDALRQAAQGALEAATKRKVAPQILEGRYDGDGSPMLRLREYPTVTIVSVTIDGEGPVDPEGYRLDGSGRWLTLCDELGRPNRCFPRGLANVAVSQEIALPEHELHLAKRAVITLAAAAFAEPTRAGLSSERIEDATAAVVAMRPGEWPPIARIALGALKRRR